MTAAEVFDRGRTSERLRSGAGILRRRWLVIAAVTFACVVVAVVRHERAPKQYKATASVAFQSGTLSDSALQVTPTGSSEPQREANTELLVAHSPEVAQEVRQQLHLATPATALLNEVSVQAAPSANVLEISATTGNATDSARYANAFAEQYIAFRAKSELSGIATAESRLQQQVAALPAGSAESSALQQSLQRLSELKAVAGGGANIIGRATPPSAPTGTGLAETAAIGLLLGIAIAFSVVFLIEALDRKVTTIEEFEEEYGLPALAAVPRSVFRGGREGDGIDFLEPFRMLHSALEFTAVSHALDRLLVTSAMPEEGKTTVAVDLARAVALTGREVTLLELDLRRPTFERHFSIAPSRGLTTVLTGDLDLAEAVVAPVSDLPNLRVLPAGRLPHNPAELLGSARLRDVMSELSSDASLVIIDAAPLNPVADAHVLLNNTAIDGALVVARLDRTSRDDVRRARAVLSRHVVEAVGIVVTGIRGEGAYGYQAYSAAGPTVDHNGAALSRPTVGGQARP